MKKEIPYARTIFRFFDKNHDWKISEKELKKVKVKQLATYIGSGGKRRKWVKIWSIYNHLNIYFTNQYWGISAFALADFTEFLLSDNFVISMNNLNL